MVKDILEKNPDKKYDCSDWFLSKLKTVLNNDLNKLHGLRLIDTRHGNSIHSWDIGIKGECNEDEIDFMNKLVSNRRKHIFGTHQDGKALTIEQIKTFFNNSNMNDMINNLLGKGYLSKKDDKYNLVCGNMSFEVFKFLDPNSISITLTASDAHKLGVFYNNRVRKLTPRECARLQGYPDNYILHPQDQYAYKQLGNAVSVPVVKRIFSDFLENNISALK
jgi:DNA (cytosine-5)-methyltransferase 1